MTLPLPQTLTPAQERARREARRRMIAEQQAAGYTPKVLSPLAPHQEPAGKLFELHDLRRVPVVMTERAKTFIDASSHEGRLFPVALAEEFGALEGEHEVDHVELDLVPKSDHFVLASGDYHPVSGEEAQLLKIVAYFKPGAPEESHMWLINAIHLVELHPQTHEPLFPASRCAEELTRLYKLHHTLQQGG